MLSVFYLLSCAVPYTVHSGVQRVLDARGYEVLGCPANKKFLLSDSDLRKFFFTSVSK